jgi:hypothetical protein
LQLGLGHQRSTRPGESGLAIDNRAGGNHGLTVDDDIMIQRS